MTLFYSKDFQGIAYHESYQNSETVFHWYIIKYIKYTNLQITFPLILYMLNSKLTPRISYC